MGELALLIAKAKADIAANPTEIVYKNDDKGKRRWAKIKAECKEEWYAKRKEWREQNIERLRIEWRLKYEENRYKILEQKKKHYEANKAKMVAKSKAYREKKKQERLDFAKKYGYFPHTPLNKQTKERI